MKTKLFLVGLALTATTTLLTAQTGNGNGVQEKGQGEMYIDANNDGVCDNYVVGQRNGNGRDKGISDRPGRGQGKGVRNGKGNGVGNGNGNGTGFVDANNDGVCDNYESL